MFPNLIFQVFLLILSHEQNCIKKVNQSDPYYLATKKHFYDLISRFGDQIFCLNLVKTVEAQKRESILVEEYQKAIDYVNKDFEEEPITIRLHNYDMKNILKKYT